MPAMAENSGFKNLKSYLKNLYGNGATEETYKDYFKVSSIANFYNAAYADSITYPDAHLQDADAQLAWLEAELAAAAEDWVIVTGHHPVYADTSKDESERTDMQARVGEILRRHRVDFYICGHIHNFQHIRPAGQKVDYVVNSSASLSRTKVKAVEGAQFISGEAGFARLTATATTLTLDLINAEGKTLHTITHNK